MSWLWKSDSTSPASFEKALSKLSTQITSANLALDVTRSRARRSKALWTLYTTLTYLLFVLIIALVIGPYNWTVYHYGGLLGAPALIFGVRYILTMGFDWRIRRQEGHVDGLQKQRESKITDLKKATKYDSTAELLQKYGGGPPPRQTPSKQGTKRKIVPPVQRTGLPPPPTANIQRNSPPNTPQRPPSSHNQSLISANMMVTSPGPMSPDEPGFVPNAFTMPPPIAQQAYNEGPHWYDRILDVLLGDDEAAAKNRLALICQNCRLVNGQAPPGAKSLEDVGRWRCSSCSVMNGVESESTKVMQQMAEKAKNDTGDWEEVSKSPELQEPETSPPADEVEGSTGLDTEITSSVTKRQTRSAAKEEPLESLE